LKHISRLSLLLLVFVSAAVAQHFDPNTQINWPRTTGDGSPSPRLSCGPVNYGQPYRDITSHTSYVCDSTGWVIVAASSGSPTTWGLIGGNLSAQGDLSGYLTGLTTGMNANATSISSEINRAQSAENALTSAVAGKEPGLGNPSVDGYVLSSTHLGVRSWVAQSAGGGSMTWPAGPGLTVCTGTPCTAWSTSLAYNSGTNTATLNIAGTATSAASATSATTATTGTNLAGGAIGSFPYQSAAGTTAMLSGNPAASDQVLTSTGTGSAPQAPTLKNAPALNAANMTGFPTLNQNTTGNAATATVSTALATNGTGNQVWGMNSGGTVQGWLTGGLGTPGGSNTQVQFNDAGALGGDSGLTYDKSTKTLSAGSGTGAGDIALANAGGSYKAHLNGASVTSNYTWKLPPADAAGMVQSDGSGNLTVSPLVTVDVLSDSKLAGTYASTKNEYYSLAAGATRDLVNYQSGDGYVSQLFITLYSASDAASLQSSVVKVYYGGSGTPSITATLAQFFGVYGMAQTGTSFSSRYFSAVFADSTKATYETMLPIPFSGGIQITLTNSSGGTAQTLWSEVSYQTGVPDTWPNTRKLLLATTPYAGCTLNNTLTLANVASGKGRVFGLAWYMNGTANFQEGNFTYYVNGSGTPSLVSSGTEDYFQTGFNWTAVTTPWSLGGLIGVYTSVGAFPTGNIGAYRYHIRDQFDFTNGFNITWQCGDSTQGSTGSASAATTVWYYTE